MPVVPIRPRTQTQVQAPTSGVYPTFIAMAAAQMVSDRQTAQASSNRLSTYTWPANRDQSTPSDDERSWARQDLDRFAKDNKMKAGDHFQYKGIGRESGEFEYLGPDSDSDFNYRKLPDPNVPTS